MQKEKLIMEETNVKIGGGRSRLSLGAWVKRYSPFGFETLKEVPWPTWAFPFVVLFFCMFWRGYERNFHHVAWKISDSVGKFVVGQMKKDAKKPQLMVLGSSSNGNAVDTSLLFSATHCPTEMAVMGMGNVWGALRILKKYDHLMDEVRVVCIDIHPDSFSYYSVFGYGVHFFCLRSWNDLLFPNETLDIPLHQRLLPLKHPLRDLFIGEEYNVVKPEIVPKYVDAMNKNRSRYADPTGKWTAHIPNKLDPRRVQDLYELIEYCRGKSIFLIITIPPKREHNPLRNFVLPSTDTDRLTEKQFLVLLEELKTFSNVRVFPMRYTKDLFQDRVDMSATEEAKYMRDAVHLSPVGKQIYTNWLLDQMQSDPQIVAALNTPRKPKDFFVEKYAKQVLRPVAKWLRASPATKEDTKPIMVASPSNTIPKR